MMVHSHFSGYSWCQSKFDSCPVDCGDAITCCWSKLVLPSRVFDRYRLHPQLYLLQPHNRRDPRCTTCFPKIQTHRDISNVSGFHVSYGGGVLLWMEEILHQLVGGLSHYLQGFNHPRWCRISAISSINVISPGGFLSNPLASLFGKLLPEITGALPQGLMNIFS